jgi:hypothetical protein
LRNKARAFKEAEGEIATLTPEEMLRFGEFTQLEDMAAYVFGIKPFSDEFNDAMYYPALQNACVGGARTITVDELFANEGGKYTDSSPECKEGRQIYLGCVADENKYKMYTVNEKQYTGGQLFAKDNENEGYILKGPEFDSLRSSIAVDGCKSQEVRVGGTSTTVSNLFSYEFDKKQFEEDRNYYARIFLNKLQNYFEYSGSNAGVPVVFNAMIYLISGVSNAPEPAVYLLDPHDMTYLGDKFKDKKKRVPVNYILGSPTGATLFFPPNDPEAKARIKQELESDDLANDAKVRFAHLCELALFNKESYLSQLTRKHVGEPIEELAELFTTLERFGENVFDNAIIDELVKIFGVGRDGLALILEFVQGLPFSFDVLADEIEHHMSEVPKEIHREKLVDLFKVKNVFISLPSFLKLVVSKGLASTEEIHYKSCIEVGRFINMARISTGMAPATRSPLKDEELNYYTAIFRGMLYLFHSQDRYSHVELVDEYFGGNRGIEELYVLAGIGEGLVKGNEFRNLIWANIVENAMDEFADKMHKVFYHSVDFESSIDRFLKQLEKGEMRLDEKFLQGIAAVYEEACNYLALPLEGVLWTVDKLKSRMKSVNIIKRQILVAISGNINSDLDLMERISKMITIDSTKPTYDFVKVRESLRQYASRLHFRFVHGSWRREIPNEIADGSYFKGAEHAADVPEVVKILNQLRLDLGRDITGLQEAFATNIGNIADIENLAAVVGFNDKFKLDGQKETDFAAKVNVVYNEMYEKFDFDEVVENISPLTIK